MTSHSLSNIDVPKIRASLILTNDCARSRRLAVQNCRITDGSNGVPC